MLVASAVLFWVALVLYCIGACFYAYQFLLRRQSIGNYARLFVFIGFLAQTTSIGFTSMLTHGTILTGPNVVTLASWTAVLVYFVFELISRVRAYGAFFIPIAIVLMSIGRILTSLDLQWATNYVYYSTPLLVFHIIVLLIAFAAFIIGAISSGLLIYQESLLKQHKSTRIGRRIPALSTLKRGTSQSVLIGFPFLTVGMFIGVIMSAGQNYPQWYFSPRIILVAVLWVVCAVYLFQVYRSGTSVRTSSYVAIAIGVITVLLLIAVGAFPMFMPKA